MSTYTRKFRNVNSLQRQRGGGGLRPLAYLKETFFFESGHLCIPKHVHGGLFTSLHVTLLIFIVFRHPQAVSHDSLAAERVVPNWNTVYWCRAAPGCGGGQLMWWLFVKRYVKDCLFE